jgi:hypothetical protein
MLQPTLLALSLFLSWPFGGGHQVTTQIRRSGDWTIRATHDAFTGRTSCSLSKHAIRFERDSLIFSLGRETDASDAYFRIDGGAARSVREAALEDERNGFFRNGGPIENPSGGEVVLPAAYVTGATQVAIRVSDHQAPRVFSVVGFSAALAEAKTAGCEVDDFNPPSEDR